MFLNISYFMHLAIKSAKYIFLQNINITEKKNGVSFGVKGLLNKQTETSINLPIKKAGKQVNKLCP